MPKQQLEEEQFTDEMIGDTLVTAFEGGINYWCSRVEVREWPAGCEFASDVVAKGGRVFLHVPKDGGEPGMGEVEVKVLTKALIQAGMLRRAHQTGHVLSAWFDMQDATEADCAVQFACFGDIVYG